MRRSARRSDGCSTHVGRGRKVITSKDDVSGWTQDVGCAFAVLRPCDTGDVQRAVLALLDERLTNGRDTAPAPGKTRKRD
jgi:hypothetical protein